MRLVALALLLAAGCGSAPFSAGHPCESSAECADGLLCDYGAMPHACAGMSTASSDLAVVIMMPADAAVPTD